MPDHFPSTDERDSPVHPSQSSLPFECTSHLGFSLVSTLSALPFTSLLWVSASQLLVERSELIPDPSTPAFGGPSLSLFQAADQSSELFEATTEIRATLPLVSSTPSLGCRVYRFLARSRSLRLPICGWASALGSVSLFHDGITSHRWTSVLALHMGLRLEALCPVPNDVCGVVFVFAP